MHRAKARPGNFLQVTRALGRWCCWRARFQGRFGEAHDAVTSAQELDPSGKAVRRLAPRLMALRSEGARSQVHGGGDPEVLSCVRWCQGIGLGTDGVRDLGQPGMLAPRWASLCANGSRLDRSSRREARVPPGSRQREPVRRPRRHHHPGITAVSSHLSPGELDTAPFAWCPWLLLLRSVLLLSRGSTLRRSRRQEGCKRPGGVTTSSAPR